MQQESDKTYSAENLIGLKRDLIRRNIQDGCLFIY